MKESLSYFYEEARSTPDQLPCTQALRHTVTTLLINRGMDIKSVSGIMGHSSANTTLNIYAHLMQTANKQAADIMQGVLSPEKKSFKSG